MKLNFSNIISWSKHCRIKGILLVFLISFLTTGSAQEVKIDKKAEILADQLQNWYNSETGLWETTSWWNGANALTAIIKYGQLTDNDSLIKVVENTYLKTKQFEVPANDKTDAWVCTNYINDYYDDEGWWGLAWLDAWEWTGNEEYLKTAKIIFKDITLGWDEICGGGIYWKKGLSGKSTISNELTLLLAARLYLVNNETVNERSHLQWSVDIWNWILSVKLINEKGQVQDGISSGNGVCKINSRIWTYNQGVILSGLVNLHKITGDNTYLNHAHSIAEAAINNMVNEKGILYEKLCEPDNCNGDAEQFKGVFMRHLAVLNQYSQKKEYCDFLRLNAQSIWNNAMQNGSVPPGVSWNTFSEKSNAATSSSALDALNAALSCRQKP